MTDEQIECLINAIRSISNGGRGAHSEPEGLEMLSMALSGQDPTHGGSVAGGLYEIASAIRELATTIDAATLTRV